MPEKDTSLIVMSPFVTRIALPLGGAVVATRLTIPPTPWMVMLSLISAKSLV